MAGVVETTQLAARVPVELVDQLEAIAARDPDLNLSVVVRRALRAYVADHPADGEEAA